MYHLKCGLEWYLLDLFQTKSSHRIFKLKFKLYFYLTKEVSLLIREWETESLTPLRNWKVFKENVVFNIFLILALNFCLVHFIDIVVFITWKNVRIIWKTWKTPVILFWKVGGHPVIGWQFMKSCENLWKFKAIYGNQGLHFSDIDDTFLLPRNVLVVMKVNYQLNDHGIKYSVTLPASLRCYARTLKSFTVLFQFIFLFCWKRSHKES